MNTKNEASAVAYYQAMGNKNISVMEPYLHPDVRFIGPMADFTGKEALLNAVKHFMNIFDKLTIRFHASSGEQVMLAYNLDCPEPLGIIRGAVLLTFSDGLITTCELFYDARPFETKRDEIFS